MDYIWEKSTVKHIKKTYGTVTVLKTDALAFGVTNETWIHQENDWRLNFEKESRTKYITYIYFRKQEVQL